MIRIEAIAATAGLLTGWFLATGTDKTQDVRLFDVFVIGPLIVMASIAPEKVPRSGYVVLAFIGGATVGYNWRNYTRDRTQNPPLT